MAFVSMFHDRRNPTNRRNTTDGFPVHQSFSQNRRDPRPDRRSPPITTGSDWWLYTNYVNWEAGIETHDPRA